MEIASKFEDSVMQHWNNHVKSEGKLKIFLVLAQASIQIFKKFWLSRFSSLYKILFHSYSSRYSCSPPQSMSIISNKESTRRGHTSDYQVRTFVKF